MGFDLSTSGYFDFGASVARKGGGGGGRGGGGDPKTPATPNPYPNLPTPATFQPYMPGPQQAWADQMSLG